MNLGGSRPLRVSTCPIGFFALPPGRSFSELTPLADGVRVVLVSDDGTQRLDAMVPAGAYNTTTKVGWKLSGNQKTWTFVDKSATPVNGITQVVINNKNTTRTPRGVKITVKGKKSTYPVISTDTPIQAVVIRTQSQLDRAAKSKLAAGKKAKPAPKSKANANAMTVDEDTVGRKDPEITGVMVVNSDVTKFVPVRTGLASESMMEVFGEL